MKAFLLIHVFGGIASIVTEEKDRLNFRVPFSFLTIRRALVTQEFQIKKIQNSTFR